MFWGGNGPARRGCGCARIRSRMCPPPMNAGRRRQEQVLGVPGGVVLGAAAQRLRPVLGARAQPDHLQARRRAGQGACLRACLHPRPLSGWTGPPAHRQRWPRRCIHRGVRRWRRWPWPAASTRPSSPCTSRSWSRSTATCRCVALASCGAVEGRVLASLLPDARGPLHSGCAELLLRGRERRGGHVAGGAAGGHPAGRWRRGARALPL